VVAVWGSPSAACSAVLQRVTVASYDRRFYAYNESELATRRQRLKALDAATLAAFNTAGPVSDPETLFAGCMGAAVKAAQWLTRNEAGVSDVRLLGNERIGPDSRPHVFGELHVVVGGRVATTWFALDLSARQDDSYRCWGRPIAAQAVCAASLEAVEALLAERYETHSKWRRSVAFADIGDCRRSLFPLAPC
jgi:hypothetical protein